MKKLLKCMLIATALAGFAGAATPALAQSVIRYTPSAEPKTLDPVVDWLLVTHQHAYMVYDTLFSMDENMKPQPQMVGNYSASEDGKTYTMTLREGLKFHDGSPVTTKDVIASIKRWASRDTIGQRLTQMGMQLAATDDRTFTVKMDVPTDLVVHGFAKPTAAALFIMREKEALTDATTPVSEIIGSGPFMFVADEYKPGAKAVYVKNTDYVPRDEPPSFLSGGKIVNVDKVEWLIMPDATTAVTALQAGETDIYEAPPRDLLPLLEAQDNMVTRPLGQLGQMSFLRFNFTLPPFDKVEARKAAALLIDQKAIMSTIAGTDGTYWQECYSFFACGGANQTEAGMDWARKRDVAKAKELLAASGYDGAPIILIAPGDNQILKSVATVIEAELKEGGFNVDVQWSDFAAMMARRKNRGTPAEGGWNMFPMWSLTSELDGPIGNFYMNAACEEGYVGWFCNKELVDLRNSWGEAPNVEVANKIVQQMQELSAETLPVLLLGKFTSPIAFSDTIKDFMDTPVPVFWKVKK